MWLNKQISPEEGKEIIKEMLNDESFHDTLIAILEWDSELSYEYPQTSELLEVNNINISELLEREISLCEWWNKSPVEVVLWMYYKSLHPSLKISDFEINNEILESITNNLNNREQGSAESILMVIQKLALEKSWALEIIEKDYDIEIIEFIRKSSSVEWSINKVITLHKSGFLVTILENSNPTWTLAQIKEEALPDIIHFWLIGGLNIIKNNDALSWTLANNENIKKLIILQEKGILNAITYPDSIELFELVELKNLEFVNKEKLEKQIQGIKESDIGLEEIKELILQQQLNEIEF